MVSLDAKWGWRNKSEEKDYSKDYDDDDDNDDDDEWTKLTFARSDSWTQSRANYSCTLRWMVQLTTEWC